MNPADELRTAADQLRTLAEAATPGPWEHVVDHHQHGVVDASVWADSINYYVTEKISSGDRHEADAAYIAAMGPNVGTLLAKWLASWDGVDFDEHASMPDDLQHALAIARQLNAGGQP